MNERNIDINIRILRKRKVALFFSISKNKIKVVIYTRFSGALLKARSSLWNDLLQLKINTFIYKKNAIKFQISAKFMSPNFMFTHLKRSPRMFQKNCVVQQGKSFSNSFKRSSTLFGQK